MNEEIKIAIGVAAVALIAWVVVQATQSRATPVQAPRRKWRKAKAGGDVWGNAVAMAPAADDGNAFPYANVM
jgi:hypothetical protein